MHSPALRVLLNAFRVNKYEKSLLILLVPNLHLSEHPKIRNFRHSSFTTTAHSEAFQHVAHRPTAPPSILGEAANLAVSPERREPKAWVGLVERFLPPALQSKEHAEGSRSKEDTKSLPPLLSKARSTAPLRLDILSYMGIREGRWDAVKWLLKKISQISHKNTVREHHQATDGFMPWSIAEPNPYGVSDLDEITDLPICFSLPETPYAEKSTHQRTIRLAFESVPLRSEWLGQVWATLACLTIQAADYPAEDVNGQEIMSHVLELVAHLHHIDVIPNTIYSYSRMNEASGVHKPPTLSLMAYRIMNVLSDRAWKAQDEEIRKEAEIVGAKNWYKGHEVLGPTIQPHITAVGKEIWLDLILWCCIEGGFHAEAGWIVTEMLKRKGDKAWKVIDWNEIHQPREPKLNWSAMAELQIERSYVNQIGAGLGIVGPSEAPPSVEIGLRTISREVVLALMDGLATSFKPIFEVQQHLMACRNLLNKGRSLSLETNTLNKTILALFEPGNVDIESSPEIADRMLALAPTYYGSAERHGASSEADIFEQTHIGDYSAACFGLLHRTLYAHTLRGNIQAALRTFAKIQATIDADRKRHIVEFAEDFRERERTGHGDELISESIHNIIPGIYPQIPTHILSAFLNLITNAHLYDLGNWLLDSDEVDGPFISPSLYSEINLQSALLRFAAATQNGQLFARVSEKLNAPLPPDVLRTLLHCQITLDKWDAAEEVLKHFQSEPGMSWEAADIMTVARTILRLENDRSSQPHSLARAQGLLQSLLNGEYNPPRDPSQAADYSDLRCLCQICRMLKTLPGSLHYLKEPPFSVIGRASASTEIPSEAFDILLEGVVEARGSLLGLRLWHQWCWPVTPDQEVAIEKVVTPTLQTLRVLMRPLVEGGKAAGGFHDKLVEWAVRTFKEFGLTEKEIQNELPGLIDK